MRILPYAALPLLLSACEGGVLFTVPVPDLELEVESPTYGQFVGEDDILVAGVVSSTYTTVLVEGEEVELDSDGRFEVWVPVDGPYRNIDVHAELYGQEAEERIPVFDRYDPMETWPGAMSARFTTYGLEAVSDAIALAVDDLLTAEVLLDGIPPIDLQQFTLSIDSITRDPVVAHLVPEDAGLRTTIEIQNLTLNVTASVDILFTTIDVPGAITLPSIELGLLLHPDIDEEGGILLGIGEIVADTAPAEASIAFLDLDWVADLLTTAIDFGDLLTGALNGAIAGLDDIRLGGPFEFETELLGSTLGVRLSALDTDVLGVALGLGVGLDGPAPDGPLGMPHPDGNADPTTDLALGVHEGALQPLLESELLDFLGQDIQLPGLLGGIIGLGIEGLPGGNHVPENNGWCLSIDMGEARVARMNPYLEPLASIYLPDALVTVGYMEPGDSYCTDWLVASMALELGVDIKEGTKIGFGLAAPDGKIIYYGAPNADEAVVIEGLGSFLLGIIDTLGGVVSIDLADMLGGGLPDLTDPNADPAAGGLELGGLGEISLSFTSSTQMVDEDGEPIEGLFDLGMRLFAH